MIIFDTETTNLTAPEAAPIEQQPYLVEFAAIKVELRHNGKNKKEELVEVARFEFMCKPPSPIPPDSIAITGISNEMVKGKPPFIAFYPALCDFMLGESCIVAHNLSFDLAVLRHELARHNLVTAFPWPPTQICTVERSISIKGYRMNLSALHLELTGKEHKDAHRAMADTEGLVRIVQAMKKKGLI